MMQKWLTGKNIGVAILDTGIYPHIDFDCESVLFLIWYTEEPSLMMTMDTARMWPESWPAAELP